MIAYLVVEVYHAYKIWCPCGAVKEKAGEKGNFSNSLWTNGFPENKTAIFTAHGSRPYSSFSGWSMRKGGVEMPPPRGAVPVDPSSSGASPAGDIPYLLLTRQGEGEEGRAEEFSALLSGRTPCPGRTVEFFYRIFQQKARGSPRGRKFRLDSWSLLRYVYSRQNGSWVA
jgi:hypothetical protein